MRLTRKKRSSIAAITLVLAMMSPMSAMATPATSDGGRPTYDVTKKAASEKAKILTESYATTSVQYALMDGGEIVISGQASKDGLKTTFRFRLIPCMALVQPVKWYLLPP